MITYQNHAQSFGDSESCNVNAQDNGNMYAQQYRISPREATFKLIYSDINGDLWNCTGTLINRHTSDAEVGFYFLTARHCSYNINYNEVQTLCFNYQSPDGFSSNTANSNEGHDYVQSGRDFYNLNILETEGYEYLHKSKLRLVQEYAWGDFALLEILTPVPPHFNISFAGWNPSLFHNGVTIGTPSSYFDPYISIHHPKGDIKKVSTTSYIHWNENPVATDCYTITTVINVLFGWIWGNQVSTQVICNWLDNPYFTVFGWQHGITQTGSSGSGMFNRNNNQIGVLSFGPENFCNVGNFDNYGKLRSQYSKQSIKNILNPFKQ